MAETGASAGTPNSRGIRDIFDAARDLDGPKRRAFLDQMCGSDEALRAGVEALLSADSAVGESHPLADSALGTIREHVDRLLDSHSSTVSEAKARDGARDGASSGVRDAIHAVPTRIDGCRIIRRIASGGMGTVYEAEQAVPRRRVAVKMVHPQRRSAAVADRLRRESEILARLTHPGIAQIHGAGVTDMGEGPQPWFIMELVAGVPLTKHADLHRLDVRRRLELLATICDAVQYAHERGVVHRDLKPDNILVDESGAPKVLDFGIARLVDDTDGPLTTLTHQGQILGTMAYMAPEAIEHGPDACTPRSDVYALGVIAFELLAGRLPHDIQAMAVTKALHTLVQRDPPRLDAIDPRHRGDIQTIVATALEREPERRYASAAALAADIRRHLDHQPIEARPTSALYLARKFVRRHRALTGGVASTFVVLVIGVVVSLLLAHTADRQRAIAVEQKQLALAEQIEARHANVRATRGLLAGAQMFIERDAPWEAVDLLHAVPMEHRGWAWRHLALRAPWLIDNSRTTRTSPNDWVRTSGFVSESELLQWSPTGELAVYDLRTDTVRTVPLPDSMVIVATIEWPHAPPGKAAFLNAAHEIVVIDITDGTTERVAHAVPLDRERLPTLQLSADRSLISSRTYGEPTFRVHDGPVERLTLDTGCARGGMQWVQTRFLRLRPHIVALRWGGSIFLADLDAADSRPFGFAGWQGKFAIDEDERALFVQSADGLTAFDLETLEPVRTIGGGLGPSEHLAISPDGSTVVAVFLDDRTLRALDAVSGEVVSASPIGQRTLTRTPLVAPDGRLIRAESPDEAVPWIIDTRARDASHITVLEGHASWIYQLAISPDGSLLASAAPEGDILIWDLENGRLLTRLARFVYPQAGANGHNMDAPLVFAPDGESLLFAEFDQTAASTGVTRIELESGVRTWTPHANRDAVIDALAAMMPPGAVAPLYHHATLLADGRILQSSAIQNSGHGVRVRRIEETGAQLPNRSTGRIDAGVAADPLGRTVAAGEYLAVTVRDADTMAVLHELVDGISSTIWGVAYSPDGRHLALGTEDGRIVMHDTEFFEKVCEIRLPEAIAGRRNYIYTMRWTPDGTRLVTCTSRHIRILESQRPFQRDQRVRHWNEALDRARRSLDTPSGSGAPDGLPRTTRATTPNEPPGSTGPTGPIEKAALRVALIERWAND